MCVDGLIHGVASYTFFASATRQNILMSGITTTALYAWYARHARAGEGVGDISFGMSVAVVL